ncbi:MAG: RidA family protein [Planctomycetota bacterium]
MQHRTPSERLRELGITLPPAPSPVAAYIPVRVHGATAFVSGQLPFENGELRHTGLVPAQTGEDLARGAARICAINALAAAVETIGSIDRIAGVIRIGVFVASEPGYTGQPGIANGASELMAEIFGEAGRHARAAVGVSSLPLDASVEIEFMFALHPES